MCNDFYRKSKWSPNHQISWAIPPTHSTTHPPTRQIGPDENIINISWLMLPVSSVLTVSLRHLAAPCLDIFILNSFLAENVFGLLVLFVLYRGETSLKIPLIITMKIWTINNEWPVIFFSFSKSSHWECLGGSIWKCQEKHNKMEQGYSRKSGASAEKHWLSLVLY